MKRALWSVVLLCDDWDLMAMRLLKQSLDCFAWPSRDITKLLGFP